MQVAIVSDGLVEALVCLKQVCPLSLLLVNSSEDLGNWPCNELMGPDDDEGEISLRTLEPKSFWGFYSCPKSEFTGALSLCWLIASWAGEGNEGRLRGPAGARPLRLLDFVPLGCPEAAVWLIISQHGWTKQQLKHFHGIVSIVSLCKI